MVQKHFSAVLFAAYSVFSLACLSWSADVYVRTLKHAFFYLMSPASLPILSEMDRWDAFGQNMARILRLDQDYRDLEQRWRRHSLDAKRFHALEQENERLAALLNLPPLAGYDPLAARILIRDPNDWFHSLLIGRGLADDVKVSDPVVAVQDGREVLVGQVVDIFEKTCRVLLITDPQSAVSARIERTGEEGAVEGQGSNRLAMNYLLSDGDVQVGDEVVTAGLGQIFPEGIRLGTVHSIEHISRESFRRAYLKPAVRLNRIDEVLVLRRKARPSAAAAPHPGGR